MQIGTIFEPELVRGCLPGSVLDRIDQSMTAIFMTSAKNIPLDGQVESFFTEPPDTMGGWTFSSYDSYLYFKLNEGASKKYVADVIPSKSDKRTVKIALVIMYYIYIHWIYIMFEI